MKWSIIYKQAIRPDGSLWFPERLSQEFLDHARRNMGVYLFANQYLNEVFPTEAQKFRKEWLAHYQSVPENVLHFAFIDPAIGTEDHHDFTGVVVVAVDYNKRWYLRVAKRVRVTPSELINMVFDIQNQFGCRAIGIETVAYQKAILYMLDEEMRRRNTLLPVTGINVGTDQTKEMRILSLVPRFEWGHILLSPGLHDFETELLHFPRGKHDDIIDALASLENIVYYPTEPRKVFTEQPSPLSGDYERYIIQNLARKANEEADYGTD